MRGVLGLLSGWALLMPLVVVILLWAGVPPMDWMEPFAGIAVSVPMLAFCSVGGLVLIGLSVRSLARREDDLALPR
ncbi:MAG: hypothetical protein K2P70_11865 [Hyphomonadaceae bacterium]|nr:hypothetical protein [Hyphomonadaceae bacterium]